VGDELRRACDLAKRLAMDSDEARARLNLANWIFFHGDDPESATPHLERAEKLIERHDDQYLHPLYVFSLLNMNRVTGEERRRIETVIEDVACGWVEHQGGIDATGDNRILNMIEYLAEQGVDRARALAPTRDHSAEDGKQIDNPYRRGDRFITLY